MGDGGTVPELEMLFAEEFAVPVLLVRVVLLVQKAEPVWFEVQEMVLAVVLAEVLPVV